jgi:hypothetical protein
MRLLTKVCRRLLTCCNATRLGCWMSSRLNRFAAAGVNFPATAWQTVIASPSQVPYNTTSVEYHVHTLGILT